MRDIFKMSVRPFEERDRKILDRWRAEFSDRADLKLPNNNYVKDPGGVVTNVALAGDGRLLGSLTASTGLILDPFIQNQKNSPHELLQALFMLTRSLEGEGARAGAQASYICIPDDLETYQGLVEKAGFVRIGEGCKFYKHDFFPVEKKQE